MKIVNIENKAARIKLNESVYKESMDRLIEEIGRVFGASAYEAGEVTGEITNCIENAADTLDIDIHSPGGSVLDGYTLYNELLEARARGVYVTAYVTLAASMASVIAMAADKVVIKKGGRMMIHEASGGTHGDAEEHRNRAELLESISDEIAGIYSDRTGIEKDKVRAMMKKETWLNADQAVELGFADAKFDTKDKPKAMSILDRLTKPSDEEANERIGALEATIEQHESEIGQFEAKLKEAESALQAAADELVSVKEEKESIKAEFEAAAKELEEIQASYDEAQKQIEALTEETKVSKEKVDARASEILAESGHPEPVQVEDDQNAGKSHLETFQSLDPAAASAYYKEHSKEIRAEMRRLQA